MKNTMLHIVLYERTDVNGGLRFVTFPETFDDWADADIRAKITSQQYKCRAWVAAIEKPSRIALARSNPNAPAKVSDELKLDD